MSRIIEEVMAGARKMHELNMIDDARLAEYEALSREAMCYMHSAPLAVTDGQVRSRRNPPSGLLWR